MGCIQTSPQTAEAGVENLLRLQEPQWSEISGELDAFMVASSHTRMSLFLLWLMEWALEAEFVIFRICEWRETKMHFTLSRILILDCACMAQLVLYRQQSMNIDAMMNVCRCLRYSICALHSRHRFCWIELGEIATIWISKGMSQAGLKVPLIIVKMSPPRGGSN